jgi:hypothetical protein
MICGKETGFFENREMCVEEIIAILQLFDQSIFSSKNKKGGI